MFYTIYKITNNTNQKVYVGKHKTNDLSDGYMGSGKLIRSAIKKYGLDNFTKEIIHVVENEEQMNALESEIVTEEFCCSRTTYNLCVGGQGGFSHINRLGQNNWHHEGFKNQHGLKRMTAEARVARSQKTVKTIKSKRASGELPPQAPTMLGKNHSDQTKQLMSSVRRGKGTGSSNSQFGSFWITDGYQNKKLSAGLAIPSGWIKGRVK